MRNPGDRQLPGVWLGPLPTLPRLLIATAAIIRATAAAAGRVPIPRECFLSLHLQSPLAIIPTLQIEELRLRRGNPCPRGPAGICLTRWPHSGRPLPGVPQPHEEATWLQPLATNCQELLPSPQDHVCSSGTCLYRGQVERQKCMASRAALRFCGGSELAPGCRGDAPHLWPLWNGANWAFLPPP